MPGAELKTGIGGVVGNNSDLSSAMLLSICLGCGGLTQRYHKNLLQMVDEVCMDLLNSSKELKCPTRRCVQCEDILDPAIPHNRHIRHEPIAVPHAGNPLPRISARAVFLRVFNG